MERPPTLTFRRIRRTRALEAEILDRLAELEGFYPSIIGARVLVEPAGRHHVEGNPYHVRIELSVPGADIIVGHDASRRPAARAVGAAKVRKQDEVDVTHSDVTLAIHETFAHARRRLQDYARRQRGEVKAHSHGRQTGARA
jgi:ribosome-associated translation inhibitor RaiA